jgi:hypothetical protein
VKICDGTCPPAPPAINPELLERVRSAVASARDKRFIAVAIDLADIDALLAAFAPTAERPED